MTFSKPPPDAILCLFLSFAASERASVTLSVNLINTHRPLGGGEDLNEFDLAVKRLPKSSVKTYRRYPLVDVGTSTNFDQKEPGN